MSRFITQILESYVYYVTRADYNQYEVERKKEQVPGFCYGYVTSLLVHVCGSHRTEVILSFGNNHSQASTAKA